MLQSKLINCYQKLDKKELRSFKKWLYSPLHNEHKEVQQLFDFIQTRYNITALTLQKERAWEYLYPDTLYDDARIRYLMSLALDVLLNFVGYYWATQDQFELQKNKIQYLQDKKLLKETKKPFQKAQQLLGLPYGNAYYHYQKYELEELTFELAGTTDRTRSTNISAITANATLSFMITTLRYACIALSHQNIKKADYSIDMLEEILLKISANPLYQEHPILMLYYHGYYTLLGQKENFLKLKDYLQNKDFGIQEKERREVLLMGINYSIKQLNTGHTAAIREAFEWYRFGLQQSLLLENNQLSLFAYSNIVALGLNLKEFDWTADFINEYSPFLVSDNRANYQQYNTAKLHFVQGDLNKAMQLLTQVEYDDLLLHIAAKVLLLKIYYQLNYYDALEALLSSFRIFLGRKKVLSYHKQNYLNLIAFTKKILQLQHSKEDVILLRSKIEAAQPLTEKKWLLAQLP